MIAQKIRSLKDQTLDTLVDRKQLVFGEVTVVKFMNQPQLMSFVGSAILELVPDTEPVQKIIPVIGQRRPIDDVTKREIEIPIVFSPGFVLEEHLTNGV